MCHIYQNNLQVTSTVRIGTEGREKSTFMVLLFKKSYLRRRKLYERCKYILDSLADTNQMNQQSTKKLREKFPPLNKTFIVKCSCVPEKGGGIIPFPSLGFDLVLGKSRWSLIKSFLLAASKQHQNGSIEKPQKPQ